MFVRQKKRALSVLHVTLIDIKSLFVSVIPRRQGTSPLSNERININTDEIASPFSSYFTLIKINHTPCFPAKNVYNNLNFMNVDVYEVIGSPLLTSTPLVFSDAQNFIFGKD